MTLLPVLHQKQRRQADCLGACAAMVLHYLQVPIQYERLLRLLKTQAAGTVFGNLRYLETLGLSVQIGYGDIETLHSHLEIGLPCIIAVQTGMWSYWTEDTSHAVVVIGIEDDRIYFHDPDLDSGPKLLAVTEFEMAWIEQKYLYAVVGLE